MTSAARFAALFSGYSKAHGVFTIKARDERGKAIGRATTVSGAPNYTEHLAGERGIGIIPLRDDDTLSWAAIDVDKYDLPIAEIAARVKACGLPLICCASKSGGTHLYVFMRSPQPADPWRKRLDAWASRLGVGGSEVFPKQSYRATAEDIGNWINLPYFASKERRAWGEDDWLTLEQFLDRAEAGAVSDAVEAPPEVEVPEDFRGAPPCLTQFVATGGVPEGQRHNTLFTLVAYCRKRWQDDWKERVHKLNPLLFHPPLTHDDLERNFKSMARKEYDYQCTGPYCNRSACRAASYGQGEVGGTACEIGGVTKIVGDPVYWIIEIDGMRVRCNTEQLQSQVKFNLLCMNAVTRCPAQMPTPRWLQYVDSKIKVADVVESPAEASPYGAFLALLEQYLSQKNRRAMMRDEVVLGKPFYEEAEHVFLVRGPDLVEYLDERRFRYETRHKVWEWLREAGATHREIREGRKTVKVWVLPARLAGAESDRLALPKENPNDATSFVLGPAAGSTDAY